MLDNGGPMSPPATSTGDSSTGSSGGLSYPGIIGIIVAAGIILFVAAVAAWLWYLRVKAGVSAVKNGDESIIVDEAMHNIEMQETGMDSTALMNEDTVIVGLHVDK